MATYGKEFRYNPPRRRKQRYALVERVVDFSNAPVTAEQCKCYDSVGSE
jgi:hypothetical protein